VYSSGLDPVSWVSDLFYLVKNLNKLVECCGRSVKSVNVEAIGILKVHSIHNERSFLLFGGGGGSTHLVLGGSK